MAAMSLDTNILNAETSTVSTSSATVVTMYVLNVTGTHTNRHVGLKISPDGTDWVEAQATIKGERFHTYTIAANSVKAFVEEAEGVTSTVSVHIVAR